LKKLFFAVLIFLLSVNSSYAVLFINGEGNYMSTGDYIPVMGFGGGLGFSLNENISFIMDGSYSSAIENVDDAKNKKKYRYARYTGGLEYIPPLDLLDRYKIYWRTSLSVGGSDFEVRGETNGVNCDDNHSGVVTMFKTGLQYNFTQVISPFFNAGYHKTFFNTEKTSMSVNGFEIDLGIRFYLGGNRDYENGY